MTICYLGILSILKSIHNLYVPLSICTTTQNLLRATTIDNFFFCHHQSLVKNYSKRHTFAFEMIFTATTFPFRVPFLPLAQQV